MAIYSRALHTSHLFYGTLSARKSQSRYVRLIKSQLQQLAVKEQALAQSLSANCLVQVCDPEGLFTSLQNLQSLKRIKQIFVLCGHDLKNLKCWKHYSKVCFVECHEDIHGELPLIVLRSGELLHEYAVACYLSEPRTQSCVISCDSDSIDEQGARTAPRFYPQWDPDLQLSSGYINSGFCVFGENLQYSLIDAVLNQNDTYSFAMWIAHLYFNEHKVSIHHIPLTLFHRKAIYENNWGEYLSRSIAARQWPFSISSALSRKVATINWPIQSAPFVSIIIPTRNGKDLVETCIQSILKKTTYQKFEILLIDNKSDDLESISYFNFLQQCHSKVRVIQYPFVFNYSAINNFAVKHANGSVLAFVNNDIEVISPDWLTHMVSHVRRPTIGCVGAKLYYPNRRVQHAGVILGYGGGAGHAHKHFPDYHEGYLNRLICTHAFSAVTAACLLIERHDFDRVNGFDEKAFPIAFNDVDLCLKIAELGLRNLFCAEAELYHYESISRGAENTQEKRIRFESELKHLKQRWAHYIEADPAYNPNLTLRQENFAVKE
ncbi:glycosyltransferase family 2 protein [Alteromonas oceanisediminis]|uniref:glycosyltransferase family 2 protein n=1 Tax=Alteromonas oceanisediminis TaxID=2836180 RepID=UPI001BD9EA2C|nr:glycosyltransferase family 2 protein [Alteromonas oceanisediminis]MBT0585059.1 glycosyltransferase family 2 protein [Alteromonas oceanisediminis]